MVKVVNGEGRAMVVVKRSHASRATKSVEPGMRFQASSVLRSFMMICIRYHPEVEVCSVNSRSSIVRRYRQVDHVV